MKKFTQLTASTFALITSVMSTSVFAGADNCNSFFPKVPYNCEVVKVKILPLERADFSAFETGTPRASASNVQYKLRSVSRYNAKKLRAEMAGVVN